MARIKVTGYIDTEELSAAHVDLDAPTGLSPGGELDLTTTYGYGVPLKLSDLEDIELELEN